MTLYKRGNVYWTYVWARWRSAYEIDQDRKQTPGTPH